MNADTLVLVTMRGAIGGATPRRMIVVRKDNMTFRVGETYNLRSRSYPTRDRDHSGKRRCAIKSTCHDVSLREQTNRKRSRELNDVSDKEHTIDPTVGEGGRGSRSMNSRDTGHSKPSSNDETMVVKGNESPLAAHTNRYKRIKKGN